MLKLFKSKAAMRYALIFFLGIVSIGMVITLAPLPTGDFGRTDNSALAQIDGQSITVMDVRRVLDERMRAYASAANPQLIAGLVRPFIDEMVLQRAYRTEAERFDLEVTDAELQRTALQSPLYQNGTFIGRERVEQETGMTLEQYEATMREHLLIDKLRRVVTDAVQVTTGEILDEFVKRNTKAKIEYVVFDPNQLEKEVTVTPQALQVFFSRNPDRYKLPEQRRVRYVLIDPDHVRAQARVSDDEIARYYQEHRSDFRVPERVRVSHILFKTSGKTAAETASVEKIARDALAQARSGADFAELARKYSEDSTAAKGGDLGWIVRGQTVKEFETAAFSLKPGQISDVVKTEYGLHILKVGEHQLAHLQTLDEVRENIRQELERGKLEAAEQAAADDFVRKLKAEPKNFDAIARQAGLEPKDTGLIRFNQVVPDFGKNDSFSNLAFQLTPLEAGQPINVAKGLAVIEVTDIVPEHTPKLDEVRDKVEQDYRAEQSKVVATQKAAAFAASARAGDFKAAAREFHLTVKESKEFSRQDYVEGLGPGSALAAAFTLAPGQTSDPVQAAGASAVFRVTSRTPANPADLAAQKEQIESEVEERKRGLAFEIYKETLKEKLKASGKLKFNEAAISDLVASYSRQ